MLWFPELARFRSRGEVSASLLCLTFIFLPFFAPAGAAVWHLNDDQTQGDRLTKAAGNDQSGDGTAAAPFRSLARALRTLREGDTLLLDTGDYDLPQPSPAAPTKKSNPMTLSKITMQGSGADKTFLRSPGINGLAFSRARGVRLLDFSIIGGDSSLFLDNCDDFTLLRLSTRDSRTYGILLKDSHTNKIELCRTENSRFRGINFRRSNQNTLSKHVALKNGNAGICLETSEANTLRECQASENGKSGIYLFRKSLRNRVEKCLSSKNKFVGIYVDRGCSGNHLSENHARHNERGFTLKAAVDNNLRGNVAASNRGSGFWIKDRSSGGRFEGNQATLNQASGFIFSPDSLPSVYTDNHSKNNKAPDQLGGEPAKTTPVFLSELAPSL